jgi:hypothetical protein
VIRAATLCLLAASPAALAADVPVVQPMHDVDVTYKVPVPGADNTALLQRLRWSASLRRQRVDLPTSGNWMVLDFAAHRMLLVRDDTRTILALPAPPDPPPSAAGFARAGDAVVAGLPCTEWRTRDTRGGETLACYGPDGVLLRATSGDRVLMEAVSVHNAPQPADVFDVPAGYTRQEGER